jgi:hypothetical protein
VTQDAEERRLDRIARKTNHGKVLMEMRIQERSLISAIEEREGGKVCWEYVRSGGKCSQVLQPLWYLSCIACICPIYTVQPYSYLQEILIMYIHHCMSLIRHISISHIQASCLLIHKELPVTALPVSMRFLIDEDHFPATREACTFLNYLQRVYPYIYHILYIYIYIQTYIHIYIYIWSIQSKNP